MIELFIAFAAGFILGLMSLVMMFREELSKRNDMIQLQQRTIKQLKENQIIEINLNNDNTDYFQEF